MPRRKPKTIKGKQGKVEKVMSEWKAGKLRSRSKRGPKVHSRLQAIAIALNKSGQSKKRKRNER